MRLLNESSAPLVSQHFLNEKLTRADGRAILEGPSQRLDWKNENNRIYPRKVWEKNLVESGEFQGRIKRGQVLGELEHPESGNTSLTRVSHQILKAWIQDLTEGNKYNVPAGTYVFTRARIFNTPMGQILREIAEHAPVGTSSRGRGDTVKEGDAEVVAENFMIDTWDYVYRPSVAEAYHTLESKTMDKKRIVKEQGPDLPNKPPGDGPLPPLPPDGAKEDEAPMGDGPLSGDIGMDDKGEGPDSADLSSATALVDRLGDLLDSEDPQELLEIVTQAAEAIGNLRSDSSDEAVKVTAQLVLLVQVIAKRVEEVAGIKKKAKRSETAPSGDSESEGEDKAPPKEKDEPSEDEGEDKKKPPPFEKKSESTRKHSAKWVLEHIDELAADVRRKGILKEDFAGVRSMTPDKNSAVFFRMMLEAYAQAKSQIADMSKKLESKEDAVSRTEFEGAVKLSITLAEKGKKVVESLKTKERDYTTALGIINGMTKQFEALDKENFILTSIVDKPGLKAHREALKECKTKTEAQAKIAEIEKLTESKVISKDGDLPLVTEDSKNRVAKETKTEKVYRTPRDLMEAASNAKLW